MTWESVLDALERDVAEVEELLATDPDWVVTDGWTPPESLGPIPPELVPRADAILARQYACTQAITAALTANRKHANAAARIETGSPGAPRPAYFDFAG